MNRDKMTEALCIGPAIHEDILKGEYRSIIVINEYVSGFILGKSMSFALTLINASSFRCYIYGHLGWLGIAL